MPRVHHVSSALHFGSFQHVNTAGLLFVKLDIHVVYTRHAWQSLVYIPLGVIVSPSLNSCETNSVLIDTLPGSAGSFLVNIDKPT